MTSQDPLEILGQTEQHRTDQQLKLASDVLSTFKAMQEAEQALYQARVRYIRSFKRATGEHWKAKELRDAGFPTPKVSVLRRRMDVRHLMRTEGQGEPQSSSEQ